jgi:6-pyruvoyltetrahydropterin/6-carboxytetrahydropterin synthase
MSKITCTKYYEDYPFAHRQPKHDGHCALIHGHNWGFEFTFSAKELDACGFVVDFGKLKWLRDWLDGTFDHTLVLNEDDPALDYLREKLQVGTGNPFAKLVVVPDCSSEGLAKYVFHHISGLIKADYGGRVVLDSVTVFEDSKNKATYTA